MENVSQVQGSAQIERVPPSIIPLKALPAVGVVFALLVAALVTGSIWALDFFHVVGGAIWTVLDLFIGFIIGPILGRLPVQARMEFSTRFMPKMMIIMPTVVIATLAAGFQLALKLGNLSVAYPQHWWITASAMVVAVMALVAIGVLEPANLAVLIEMRRPQPRGHVIEKLMKRFIYSAGITGAMQIATLILMTRIATW
jgi:hypothetical protein